MKQMKPLISVIVPVYNVEQYVEACLRSLVTQTYENIEIIVIDDGSTDRSGQICDVVASKFTNVFVYHQSNRGVSAARNEGLTYANGRYVAFCDSDDIVHKEMYERMLFAMLCSSAEIAACAFQTVPEEVAIDNNVRLENQEDEACSKEEFLSECLTGKKYGGYIWNKMFSRDLIDRYSQTRFREDITVLEDQLFLLECIDKCHDFICVNDSLYFYRQYRGSTLHRQQIDKMVTAIYVRTEVYRTIEAFYPHAVFLSAVWNLMIKCYVVTAKKLVFSNLKNKKAYLVEICEYFRQEKGKYPLDKGWRIKDKCYYAMLTILSIMNRLS